MMTHLRKNHKKAIFAPVWLFIAALLFHILNFTSTNLEVSIWNLECMTYKAAMNSHNGAQIVFLMKLIYKNVSYHPLYVIHSKFHMDTSNFVEVKLSIWTNKAVMNSHNGAKMFFCVFFQTCLITPE